MRVLFMGTPEFAVPTLESLAATHDVVMVVTRPDAIRGRGRIATPSAVKAAALGLSLPVIEASRVGGDVMSVARAAAVDVVVVAAFGALLPDSLLGLAPYGAVNVHASLLPRWRGAAPIQRAVLAGDERVGVSIMRLVHELDAGAYCRQASIPVMGRNAVELTRELATLGASELVAALNDIVAGKAIWTEQDESAVTYAHKLTKAEMRLAPTDDALINSRRVAASSDAVPARITLAGKGVRVLDAEVADVSVAACEVAVAGKHVYLGCGHSTTLELVRVRPDGRRDMDAGAWAQGLRGGGLTWSEP